MNFTDFNLQTLSMQAHLVCRDGIYLSERIAGGHFVALYSLFHFYAEVYYRLATSEVLVITGFYNTALLEPYLSRVNLQLLLQPSCF